MTLARLPLSLALTLSATALVACDPKDGSVSGTATAGSDQTGSDDTAFYEAKLTSANYYAERFLPDAGALRRKLEAGSEHMMKLPEEAFATAA